MHRTPNTLVLCTFSKCQEKTQCLQNRPTLLRLPPNSCCLRHWPGQRRSAEKKGGPDVKREPTCLLDPLGAAHKLCSLTRMYPLFSPQPRAYPPPCLPNRACPLGVQALGSKGVGVASMAGAKKGTAEGGSSTAADLVLALCCLPPALPLCAAVARLVVGPVAGDLVQGALLRANAGLHLRAVAHDDSRPNVLEGARLHMTHRGRGAGGMRVRRRRCVDARTDGLHVGWCSSRPTSTCPTSKVVAWVQPRSRQ